MDVVTFGETMGVLRFLEAPQVGARPRASFAGAESNVAIGLARLGHTVAWGGSLGNDLFGDLIVKTLRGEGVNTAAVERIEDRSTGLLASLSAGLGALAVDYYRAKSAGRVISANQIDYLLGLEPKILHITGITPALGERCMKAVEAAVAGARDKGVTVTFDVNFRARLWDHKTAAGVLSSIAKSVDVVFGGTAELELLTGNSERDAAIAQLLEAGVREVVWKESSTALVATPDHRVERPGLKVDPVDTIGAGDAFAAGYISGLLDGLDAAERLDRAHLLGAYTVGTLGDWEGGPSRAQISRAPIEDGEVAR
ncbi:2-dehydro-3-deoxygluconokinase [Actinobaculum suis]|uniref:2-dehydro-3-deoxygluconokinase n=1 Tax=Actinobaculum suis TaxID=1657 RepID=A0A1G7EQ95_9ACTO|nr:sugar kinase [Actinobaculum suis]MDY5152845.1 sugar kinase [Actinobaculum suis]SDE65757.1 2-dehydro-3-deoxygluconokinase [Actinobaculum suis]